LENIYAKLGVIKEADLAGSAIEIIKGIIGELDKLFDPAQS